MPLDFCSPVVRKCFSVALVCSPLPLEVQLADDVLPISGANHTLRESYHSMIAMHNAMQASLLAACHRALSRKAQRLRRVLGAAVAQRAAQGNHALARLSSIQQ